MCFWRSHKRNPARWSSKVTPADHSYIIGDTYLDDDGETYQLVNTYAGLRWCPLSTPWPGARQKRSAAKAADKRKQEKTDVLR